MSTKTYTSPDIDVTFDAERCIHAAECVHKLSAVFDTDKRPWIQPDNAEADDVAAVVEQCPSGALQYRRKDTAEGETADAANTIHLVTDGPLYVRGTIEMAAGETETRLALCRCGASNNKPLCDNAHKKADFRASGKMPVQTADNDAAANGPLAVNPADNGPLLLRGNFTIEDEDGHTVFQGRKAALCRCGASMNKPFCDGTHKTVGFTTE